MRVVYINRFGDGYRETVDEVSGQGEARYIAHEARKLLAEYQLSDPAGSYYLSQRCCQNWRT